MFGVVAKVTRVVSWSIEYCLRLAAHFESLMFIMVARLLPSDL